MVFLDPEELKWKPHVQTWLQSKFTKHASASTKVCYIIGYQTDRIALLLSIYAINLHLQYYYFSAMFLSAVYISLLGIYYESF